MRATSIGLLVVTSIVVGIRTTLTIYQHKSIRWDDGWLFAGYFFFMAMTILYLAKASVIFSFWGVIDGTKPVYSTMMQDDVTMRKVSLAANILFYSALWSVKFSLLAFYKQLMARLQTYVRAWWVVTTLTSIVGTLMTGHLTVPLTLPVLYRGNHTFGHRLLQTTGSDVLGWMSKTARLPRRCCQSVVLVCC